jgi:hypothetical protein
VSVTHQMIPSRVAIRYGVMVPQGLLLVVAAGTGRRATELGVAGAA